VRDLARGYGITFTDPDEDPVRKYSQSTGVASFWKE